MGVLQLSSRLIYVLTQGQKGSYISPIGSLPNEPERLFALARFSLAYSDVCTLATSFRAGRFAKGNYCCSCSYAVALSWQLVRDG